MRKLLSVGLVAVSVFLLGQFTGSAVILPPSTVTLIWDYPQPSADIVFNVYQSTNAAASLSKWKVATNVTVTTCTLPIQPGNCFYTVTASNKVTKLESRLK